MNRFKSVIILAALSLSAAIWWYNANDDVNQASCFSPHIDTDLELIVSSAQVYPCSTEELLEFGSNHFSRVICALQDGSYPDKSKSRQYKKMSRFISEEFGYPIGYHQLLTRLDTNTTALSVFTVETSGLPFIYFSLPNFRDVYQQWMVEGVDDVQKNLDHLIAVATIRRLEVVVDELLRNRATQTAAR
jgi:hypothetical protein